MRYLQALIYGIKVTIHCYPFVLDHLDFTHEDLAPVRKSVFIGSPMKSYQFTIYSPTNNENASFLGKPSSNWETTSEQVL